MKVCIISQSIQAITCELSILNHQPFIYTSIYASNVAEDHNDLWIELLQLHSSLNLAAIPWIIGGDFNQILYGSEHIASFDKISHAQMY